MGRFKDTGDMDTHTISGGNFQFSAAKIDTLEATEYTLATVVVDGSGSVAGFWAEIQAAIKEVVRACQQSPRADNLMFRVLVFDSKLQEFHGFRPLRDCNESDYDNLNLPGGLTALYDASYECVKATTDYGRQLTMNQFAVNGAVFVITDGMDNQSKVSPNMVKDALQEARTSEAMESIMSVLIGVNTNQGNLDQYLENFKRDAEFQQFVAIGQATPKELAKLGGFVSRSISSQSQALHSGGPSKSLSF